jgi:hypothetical protein
MTKFNNYYRIIITQLLKKITLFTRKDRAKPKSESLKKQGDPYSIRSLI